MVTLAGNFICEAVSFVSLCLSGTSVDINHNSD